MKVYCISGYDGSALYVNGKLVSEHFTIGEQRIVEALGHTIVDFNADPIWYDETAGNWPESFDDCIL